MRLILTGIATTTLVACAELDHNTVSGADNGVDVSEFTAQNGPQDMSELGYPNQVGFPTLGAKFNVADACYAGINAAGTENDWEADNMCAQPNGVTIEETSTTYMLIEFDPGNGSSGYYHGNVYNNGDDNCGPDVETWDCWYNLEDFVGRNKLIDSSANELGELVADLDFYSTWDGISLD